MNKLSFRFFRHVFFCIVLPAVCALSAVSSGWAAPVLMISIDGLKPEYVTQADAHGLHVPTLRRFLTEGTYSDGVLPALTIAP